MSELLQFSAGQGPSECELAVALAVKSCLRDAEKVGIQVVLLEEEPGREAGTLRSATLRLTADSPTAREALPGFIEKWTGSFQWTCPSPYRPNHARKNWFFDVRLWTAPAEISLDLSECRISTCRAGGAGGQHVNKTESAVQIQHQPTGLSVRVESERSQHRNRQLAIELLNAKLAAQAADQQADLKSRQRLQHHKVLRGSPSRRFKGMAFEEI